MMSVPVTPNRTVISKSERKPASEFGRGVDKIRATGATQQQASGLLSGLGCYVGEVFVRNAKAR